MLYIVSALFVSLRPTAISRKEKGFQMKIRKTKQDERGVYKYSYQVRTENGEYVTETVVLRPGENGVTEMDIKRLHALDDSDLLQL